MGDHVLKSIFLGANLALERNINADVSSSMNLVVVSSVSQIDPVSWLCLIVDGVDCVDTS